MSRKRLLKVRFKLSLHFILLWCQCHFHDDKCDHHVRRCHVHKYEQVRRVPLSPQAEERQVYFLSHSPSQIFLHYFHNIQNIIDGDLVWTFWQLEFQLKMLQFKLRMFHQEWQWPVKQWLLFAISSITVISGTNLFNNCDIKIQKFKKLRNGSQLLEQGDQRAPVAIWGEKRAILR